MRILCVTDPLTHSPFDTTIELYRRLSRDARFEFFHLETSRLGDGFAIPVSRVPEALTFEGFQRLAHLPAEPAEFRDFDLVYSRTDKPFPAGFLECLIRHETDTRFVARPSSALSSDHREFVRSVASSFMPPGIMTTRLEEAAAFVRVHGDVVAKKNRSYGGKGVARIRREEAGWLRDGPGSEVLRGERLEDLLGPLLASDPEPFELVRFLPNVTEGDKRVVVVDGGIYGGILRVATDGGWINNLARGGTIRPTEVTTRETEIVAATCQAFHDRGLLVLGYDFLVGDDGEWVLSEINASGNIGGHDFAEQLTGVPHFQRFVDWLLALGFR